MVEWRAVVGLVSVGLRGWLIRESGLAELALGEWLGREMEWGLGFFLGRRVLSLARARWLPRSGRADR